MGVIDNQKYALMICDMFYNQNLTQKEISGILNISRPQVCRIISHAKNEGWITISFNYPNSEESEFEKRLRDLYGLNEVFVFDTGADDDDLSLERLAFKCSDIFDLYVKDKSRVGVMAGRTIRAFSQAIPQTKNRGIEFVPLCGGFTSNGIEWYANSNVQLLASKTGGKFYSFNAPSCVSSMELKTMLLSEDSIKEVTKLWDTCDVTIVGIGTANANSSNGLAGNLKEEDAKFLIEQGAVASCCCSYLTSNGREIHNGVTERFIGASINQIKKSMTIAMAIGSEKVPAIHSVLMSDCVDVLITSLATARRLVED